MKAMRRAGREGRGRGKASVGSLASPLALAAQPTRCAADFGDTFVQRAAVPNAQACEILANDCISALESDAAPQIHAPWPFSALMPGVGPLARLALRPSEVNA